MTYDPFSGMIEDDKQEIVNNDVKDTPKYNRGMYRVNMRIYNKGVLHHRMIRTNDLGITVKTDVGDYELNTNWLFKEHLNVLVFFLLRLKGVRQSFIAIYEKGNVQPFNLSLGYPVVSGNHLNTIKQSNALSDYLKSLFATKFDTRMMIIIFAGLGMVILYFLYSQGYIDLNSIRGLINR